MFFLCVLEGFLFLQSQPPAAASLLISKIPFIHPWILLLSLVPEIICTPLLVLHPGNICTHLPFLILVYLYSPGTEPSSPSLDSKNILLQASV